MNKIAKLIPSTKAAEIIAKYIVKYLKTEIKTKSVIPVVIYRNIIPCDERDTRCLGWTGYLPEGKTMMLIAEDNGKHTAEHLANDIASKVKAMLKLPKGFAILQDTDYYTNDYGWSFSKYDYVKRITFVKPCKEFDKINKKLASIGCAPIDIKQWGYDEISGKRDHVFYRRRRYYAPSQERCNQILAYLKGKRKVSLSYTSYENSDRDHGIEYETEWDGVERHKVVFTDAAGRTATF